MTATCAAPCRRGRDGSRWSGWILAKNYRVGNEVHPGSYLLQVGVRWDGATDSNCLVVEALD